MGESAASIRNAVRAVISRGGAFLFQRKKYGSGEERFTLPGGSADPGETLADALKRECREELGVEVEVGELLHVADFWKPRETEPPTFRQQVEFLFRCEVPVDYVAANGPHPDKHQIDVTWILADKLAETPVFPASMKRILSTDPPAGGVYLGEIR